VAANWWDGLKGFALEMRDRVVSERDRDIYLAGYETASSVFMPLVDARIDALDSKLDSGTLGSDDQKVLSALRTLRREADKELRARLESEAIEVGP
jgi:hypothetical protein